MPSTTLENNHCVQEDVLVVAIDVLKFFELSLHFIVFFLLLSSNEDVRELTVLIV